MPRTPDPAVLTRHVPGFPMWWMRHVCGGRSMSISCFESIHNKVRLRRSRRRHEPRPCSSPRSATRAGTSRRSGTRMAKRTFECRPAPGCERRRRPGRSEPPRRHLKRSRKPSRVQSAATQTVVKERHKPITGVTSFCRSPVLSYHRKQASTIFCGSLYHSLSLAVLLRFLRFPLHRFLTQ